MRTGHSLRRNRVGILAVGAGEKRPVVRGDAIVPATIMSCTLSCDHRVVDGAIGAQLLAAIKRFIERPVSRQRASPLTRGVLHGLDPCIPLQ